MRAAHRSKPNRSAPLKPPKSSPPRHQASLGVRGDTKDSPASRDATRPRTTHERPLPFPLASAHEVAAQEDRRLYPRAALRLPLRLKRVAGQREVVPLTLLTRNISSSGVYFLCPRRIEPGTPIELEVALVDRPLGRGSIHMATAGHIVRAESAHTPGWHGLAASFDDITFRRDAAAARSCPHL